MSLRHIRRLSPILCLILCAGCRTGPEHCEPIPELPDAWHQELVDNGHYVDNLNEWWNTFDDPVLDKLIQQASVNNRNLYAAVTRIQQAAARQRIAGSPKYPFVDAVGGRTNFELSETTPTYLNPRDLAPGAPHDFSHSLSKWDTGFNLSWEPDLWGRIARNIEAAEAGTCASIENYRDVLVSLHAQIAQSYVLLRQLQAQKKYANDNVALQTQSMTLAEDRLDAGLVPELDVHQARLNRSRTGAAVPRLKAGIQEQLATLAMLLGETPGSINALLEAPTDIPAAQNPAMIIIPCNMVRRRPDIRAAERSLAAATAKVGVAETDLLPRFFVGGNFGLESEDFSDLFDNDSFTFGVGPSFKWAIFRAGQIRNNITLKEAGVEEAVAQYEQSVLNAFREVQTALSAYQQEKKRRDQLLVATQAAGAAVENVSALYRAGKTNFQNVLVTQESLAQMQNQLADSEGRVAINLITLYKAMGGGWNDGDHCRHHNCRIGARLDSITVSDQENGLITPTPFEEAPGRAPQGAPGAAPKFDGTILPPEPRSTQFKANPSPGGFARIKSSLQRVSNSIPKLDLRRRPVARPASQRDLRVSASGSKAVRQDKPIVAQPRSLEPQRVSHEREQEPLILNLHGG